MLKLNMPDGTELVINGLSYKLSVFPPKYAINRYNSITSELIEAFDLFRDPNEFIIKSYQMTHYYRDSSGKLVNDARGFTIEDIRKNGLQHLIKNW